MAYSKLIIAHPPHNNNFVLLYLGKLLEMDSHVPFGMMVEEVDFKFTSNLK